MCLLLPLHPDEVDAGFRSCAAAELALAELVCVGAEAAGADQQRPRCVVEVAHIAPPVGEHHAAARVVPGDLPPVFEQALLGDGRVVGDLETSGAGGVSEVRLGVAGTQPRERLPFEEIPLAAVFGEADRTEMLAEGGVEATGADGRQLVGIADQDHLSFRPLDELKYRSEHAGLGHAGLVDDQDAAAGKAAITLGVEQESVQRAARDTGGNGEPVGGAAARCRTQHGHRALAIRVSEDAQCGVRRRRVRRVRARAPHVRLGAAPAS